MRCHHCHDVMEQTDSVAEGGARQIWYVCPRCDASHTTSQPYESSLRRIGNSQRCSNDWPERLSRYRSPF